ncbi:MAG: 1-acyl-sn-glycerol-3-phosphate acyltransferase [bacterium]|nr:1-acyl-sn-glycerol-3-phosphate acyltransferase [bacterium]
MFPALQKLYSQKGSLGVLDWIFDKKRFFFAKLFLKTLFFIFPIESILRTTSNYNNLITQKGFANSTRWFLKELKIGVTPSSNEVFEGGCLIFGNHPTGLDPFVIASCLNRDDVYIVADVYQKNKGANIGEHIIPIYYSRTQNNLKNRSMLNSIGFYIMRIFTGYENDISVKEKNVQAIETAAKKLIEGHIVIIFPDGGSNNPELWYNGIGEIIKKTHIIRNNFKLYAAHITGISTLLLIKHFLFNKRHTLSDKPIVVSISTTLTLESLHINSSTQTNEITERLRSLFISEKFWLSSYAKSKQ